MNVLLRVADASRSLAFYKSLGFREELLFEKDGRLYYGELTLGAVTGGALMFLERAWWGVDDDATPAGRDGAGQVLYFTVDDVDALRAKLAADVVVKEPRDEYYGRELVIRDPDGFKLAFLRVWPGGERLPEGVRAWRRPND